MYPPFGGMRVVVVEAGTIITDEATGQTLTVTDTEAVRSGDTLYCCQTAFDAIKAEAKPAYTCARCGITSFNPNDVRERYCGRCHVFEAL